MRLYENWALIQAHIQTLSFFSSSSFCGEMVTKEPNLIVSHENNMLQLYYTQWSWNCRGCWHQSCLQLPSIIEVLRVSNHKTWMHCVVVSHSSLCQD